MPGPPPSPDRPGDSDVPDGPAGGPPPSSEPSGGWPRGRWWWVPLLGIALLVVVVGAIGVVTSISSDVSRTVTVTYRVTGTARDVTITYAAWERENRLFRSALAPRLPWTKGVETTGFVRGRLLEVMTGAGGGRVTCSVSVDDGEPTTASARGRYAVARCGL